MFSRGQIGVHSSEISRSRLNLNSSVWKALRALTHGWHHRFPQCFAAGGTNRGDSQCKRGRIKTQGSATDSMRYHVCLTQNHRRQWGRFPSTGYKVVYLLCKHSGLYIWHTANDKRSMTWRLRPVPFFPLRKPFDTFSEARLQIQSSMAEFLRRRLYNTLHKNIGIIIYHFWTFWILFPYETKYIGTY